MVVVSDFSCRLGISANTDRNFLGQRGQGTKGLGGQDTDILDIMGTRPPSSLTRVLKAALDMCMHPGDRDDPNRREAAVG